MEEVGKARKDERYRKGRQCTNVGSDEEGDSHWYLK